MSAWQRSNDMAEEIDLARAYIEKMRWALVPMTLGTKGPVAAGWNEPQNVLRTVEAVDRAFANGPINIGLVHEYSGTVAIDIDHEEHTRTVLDELGIDYDRIIGAGMRIHGTAGRAKVLFAAPPLTTLALHKVSWQAEQPRFPNDRLNLFELRSGRSQDVLPISLHPLGHRYQWWPSQSPFDFESMPALPAEIVDFWQTLQANQGLREEIQRLCPWRPAEEASVARSPRPPVTDHHDVIGRFNAANDIEGLLLGYGYEKRGRRYRAPSSSTKIPGVVLFEDGGTQKCYSHHGSDLLADGLAHDAFDLFVKLSYSGNVAAALDAAAHELGIDRHAPLVPLVPGLIASIRAGTATRPRLAAVNGLTVLSKDAAGSHQAGAGEAIGAGAGGNQGAEANGAPEAGFVVTPNASFDTSGGVVGEVIEEETESVQLADEFKPMPDGLLYPKQTFVNSFAAWVTDTAQLPQPELALVGALSVAATLLGRKVQTETGLRTNLYLVGVAPTSAGKDHARKAIKQLLNQAGFDDMLGGEEIASGAGLMTMMRDSPNSLAQIDEFGLFMMAANGRGANSHDRTVIEAMMKLYSSAQSVVKGKARADSRMNPRSDISYPCLNVHATTTADPLFAGLTSEHALSGFLNRMLLVFNPERVQRRRMVGLGKAPQILVDWARAAREMLYGLKGTGENPITVPMSAEARALFEEFDDWQAARARALRGSGGMDALWGRAWEMAAKVALIMCCARLAPQDLRDTAAGGRLEIGFADAEYAISLVKHLTGIMVEQIKGRVSDTEFEGVCQAVLGIVKRTFYGVTERDLAKACRLYRGLDAQSRDKVINTLIRQGDITQFMDLSTGGRPRVGWKVVEYKRVPRS